MKNTHFTEKKNLNIREIAMFSDCQVLYNKEKATIADIDLLKNEIKIILPSGQERKCHPSTLSLLLIPENKVHSHIKEKAAEIESSSGPSDAFLYLIKKGVDVFNWTQVGLATAK
jgi:hypothetical protein